MGLAKLLRLPTLQPVFPVLCAFVCGVLVFELASKIPVGDPLPLLVAPLATFLPGSMLATAAVELAAGQIWSGATRLIAGVVQLGLLAIGILAAVHVVGQDTIEHARLAVLVSYAGQQLGTHLLGSGLSGFLALCS